jgi:hypothetical protein
MKRKLAATLLFILIGSWPGIYISIRLGQWSVGLHWSIIGCGLTAILAVWVAEMMGRKWFLAGLGVATLLVPLRSLVQLSLMGGVGGVNNILALFAVWGIIGVLGWCGMALVLRRTMERRVEELSK